ncbi:MAG: hypothetical protein AUG51_02710 [Acidobacteria bacterium 13_1_20CM_3_53_8]|nr:MAG: hypothetical protein AUG51_02710 [Acidobacteria bacterium 13_1_20CM_3_53_8]
MTIETGMPAEFIQLPEETQEGKEEQAGNYSFLAFLKAHKSKILLLLSIAFIIRFTFAVISPPAVNDALGRYIATANNILDGHGFSIDTSAPYTPGEATVPFYPLFVAACYAVFGRHEMAVKLPQIFIDLASCLLVAFISFTIAPMRLKRRAAVYTLIISGVFSWFSFVWTSYVLTETLAIFLTLSATTLSILALKSGSKENRYWFGAGAVCGLALLTRPDSLLLTVAIILFLLIPAARRRLRQRVLNISSFCLAVALLLSPWVVRNYITLGEFQPLASEYGFARPAFMPTGYLWWLRTWVVDEKYAENIFGASFAPDANVFFDPAQLPDTAFDSAEEHSRVNELIANYNRLGRFTPEIDRGFRAIAWERIRRAPVRFLLIVPFKRIASMWLTGTVTNHPNQYFQLGSTLLYRLQISNWMNEQQTLNLLLIIKTLSVLPLILCGLVGFALCRNNRTVLLLILSIIGIRTIFMAYHYAPEPRYMVEIYPYLSASCGVTMAVVWARARRLKQKKSDGAHFALFNSQ